jgi:hypothetical protein
MTSRDLIEPAKEAPLRTLDPSTDAGAKAVRHDDPLEDILAGAITGDKDGSPCHRVLLLA